MEDLRATLSKYGLTRLSTANNVTDSNAYTLSATEKNPNVSGSLGQQIQNVSNSLSNALSYLVDSHGLFEIINVGGD